LKYFSSDQVFNELVNGDVTREVIYASMNVARKRKYAEREKLFADALARFDEYRKENKMNIRFTDEIHKALVERANREDQPPRW
jgi:predicted HicB family RNase H-like nuclease